MSEATATKAPPHLDDELLRQLDEAVLARSITTLPETYQADGQAILNAWRAYEASDDTTARALLQTLSVTSPFNEWKLLLRGLLAHAAGEPVRALENFRRLNPKRVPARLAQPVRAELDPVFKASLPPDRAVKFGSLFTSKHQESAWKLLQKLQLELGRDNSLRQALKTAVKLLPELRRVAPQTIPLLTEVLYAQLDLKGTPSDLSLFRISFRLPSDPEFHVLEARKLEELAPDRAAKHVQKHIAWLKSNPLGWADELHRCVLANFWLDLAQLDPAQGSFALQQAAQVDPDSEVVVLARLEELTRQSRPQDYLATAGEYLQRHPEATAVRQQVLRQLQVIPGGIEHYLAFAKPLLEQNPLDDWARMLCREGLVFRLAQLFSRSDWPSIEKLIGEESLLSNRHGFRAVPAAQLVLQLRLLPAKAITEQLAPATLDFSGRFAAWCFASVSRFKPAQLKPIEAWLRVSLDGCSALDQLIEASRLLNVIAASGTKITGAKKLNTDIGIKIAQLFELLTTEEGFEKAIQQVMSLENRRFSLKMLDVFATRYPKNPFSLMTFAMIQLNHGKLSQAKLIRVRYQLSRALHIARSRPEPRYQKLIPEIEKILNLISSPSRNQERLDLF